jgi:RHS repeat-associated protein
MYRMWTTLLRKSAFEVSRLYDKFFALAEGGVQAVRRLRREILTFHFPPEIAKKKKPSLQPAFEVLENRVVPDAATITSAILRTDDPRNLGLVPIGETSVDANVGAVRISQPLDFDLSPGTGMGRSPALVYNSATVAVRPIVQVTVTPDAHRTTTEIDLQLSWAGTQIGSATYSGSFGSTPVLAVESTNPMTQTDHNNWSVTATVKYASGDPDTPSASGTGSFVVQDSSVSGQVDPYGAGWGIRGVDRIFSVTGGLLWAYGTGESDFFASSGGGYTSPTGNFGTLTGNSSIGYTYIANGQGQEQFAPNGLMTSVACTCNFTATYGYDGTPRLTSVTARDASTTTLDYDGNTGLLRAITEPGGRKLSIGCAGNATNGGCLTNIVDAAGYTRTMGYDSAFRLTSDTWAPYGTTLTYSPTTGTLNNVNLGSGAATLTYAVAPAALQGLQGAVSTATFSQGTVTDALTRATTYDFDSQGRMLGQHNPVGDSRLWQFDPNALLTASVDGNGNTSTYGYDSFGQLTSEVIPNGPSFTYSRDHSTDVAFYDRVTLAVENGVTTSSVYDSQGQLSFTVDADTHTTTYAWSNHRMTQQIDPGPLSGVTSYTYDSNFRLTSVVNPVGNTTTTTYDGNGNISQVAVVGGIHTTTYNYDSNNQLTAQTNAAGDSATYTYSAAGFETTSVVGGITNTQGFDARGLRTFSTDGNGGTTQYKYDTAGEMTATIDPNAKTWQQSFDADGRVTQTIDPTKGGMVTTTFKYDNNDNVIETTNTNGVDKFSTLQSYDAANHLTKTVDPDTHTTLESYDSYGRLTLTTDGAGSTTSRQIKTSNGLLTATVDGVGTTTQYNFDTQNRVTQTVVDPTGLNLNTYQYYDKAGHITATVNANTHTTTMVFDTAGNVTATVDTVGSANLTVLTSYDGDNRVTQTVVDYGASPHLNLTTKQSYDDAGRVTTAVDANSKTSTMAYDGDSNLIFTKNGAGNTTQNQYDPDNNLTKTIDADNFPWQYTYDAAGRNIQTIDPDPNPHTSTQKYDHAGRLTATTDFGGRQTTYTLDLAGLATKIVDPNGYTQTLSYDGDNRVTQTVDGDSHATSTAYDGAGRVTLVTDGNTHTHQTQYDKAGRMTATVDGGNHTTQMLYDPDGNKTAVVDPNTHTTQYAFDQLDRLIKVIDSDTNTTTYSLDAAGRATNVISPAPTPFTTTQGFDGNGHITQLTTQDGGIVNYTYDDAGRMLTNGNGTFTYDGRGHILTATSPLGTGTASYAFSYDPAGRLTNVTEPFTLTLSYSYDNAGNQTQVIDSLGGTTSSTYDSDNFLTQRTYQGQTQTFRFDFANNKEGWNTTLTRYNDLGGNTLVAKSVYGYDSVGQVTSVLSTDKNGATINQFVYSLDSGDRLTSETDTQNGATTTTSYSYDSAGQLLPASTLSYTYDPNGNRTGGSSAYTVTTGNQMTADLSWTYSYDNEGNLKEKDTKRVGSSEKWMYTYNASNELTEVNHYNTQGIHDLTVDYKYDAFGEQIEEDVNGTAFAEFGIDGWNSNMANPTGNENINVWARLDQNNHLITRYVWGDRVDQQLARIDLTPATPYWTLQDRLGSIRDVIDYNGAVKDDIQYDAFGNINLASETNSGFRGWYAYSGREYDTEINLQYNHARWYDSFSGRWISQDPLGFDAGDSNLYRYVNNGPTGAIDPSGLAPDSMLRYALEVSNNTPYGSVGLGKEYADIASKEAQKRFTQAELSGGKGDAWRHCYWSALMANDPRLRNGTHYVGPNLLSTGVKTETFPAYEIGRLYEDMDTKQSQMDRAMDMHNNNVGLQIGTKLGPNASRDDLMKACDKMLQRKQLIWIEPELREMTPAEKLEDAKRPVPLQNKRGLVETGKQQLNGYAIYNVRDGYRDEKNRIGDVYLRTIWYRTIVTRRDGKEPKREENCGQGNWPNDYQVPSWVWE